MCLLIGAVGIAARLIQLTLIQPLENVFANAGNITVYNFTQNIENEITNAIGIDSAAYATAVNKWLGDATTTATVNNDLFGFANTAANAVNNTIVQFYTSIENSVHSTFDGTAFAVPIIEFLCCVVSSKAFALESGLAWLKQNLNLRLPHVAPDVLTLGAGNVSEPANPVSVAAMLAGDGSGNGISADESGNTSGRSSPIGTSSRANIFSIFLGAYALVVLNAIVIMIFKSRRNASPAPTAEREMSEKSVP